MTSLASPVDAFDENLGNFSKPQTFFCGCLIAMKKQITKFAKNIIRRK